MLLASLGCRRKRSCCWADSIQILAYVSHVCLRESSLRCLSSMKPLEWAKWTRMSAQERFIESKLQHIGLIMSCNIKFASQNEIALCFAINAIDLHLGEALLPGDTRLVKCRHPILESNHALTFRRVFGYSSHKGMETSSVWKWLHNLLLWYLILGERS